VLDGVEDSLDVGLGLEAWLGALLVDTSLDEDRVPVGLVGVLVELVGATDVRLGSVADKVDSRGGLVDTVSILAPALEQACGEFKGADLGLAVGSRLELLAGDGLVHGLEGHAEGAHANAGQVVRSAPNDVVVGEEDWWALIKVLRSRAETAVLGHQQVENDLLVRRPVARVGKDEDGLNVDLGEVASAGVLVLLRCQCAERRRVLVILDNIARGDTVSGQ
jgi:hypothetical protein